MEILACEMYSAGMKSGHSSSGREPILNLVSIMRAHIEWPTDSNASVASPPAWNQMMRVRTWFDEATYKFEKNFWASWVKIDELCDVVDIVSDNDPTVVFATVHRDFGTGEGGVGHFLVEEGVRRCF